MGVHHVAFAVEDGVANALAQAEGAGIRLIDKLRVKEQKAFTLHSSTRNLLWAY